MNLRETLMADGCRVAVLCGGDSSERAVSLVSGNAVATALRAMDAPCDLFELPGNRLPDALSPATHVVLPIVHGSYGEDGRLSAELDARGFAYAGCDQASSVLCFDKLASKTLAAYTGVPVAADLSLIKGTRISREELCGRLGDAFILKPRRDGSSVGLHLVRDDAGFAAAAADLARTDYLAESFIDGYDLTVGILGGEPLGVVGVHPEGGLYDYHHKYTSGLSRYDVPARIDDGLAGRLREWSRLVFRACGCRDLARVDFRLGHDGRVAFLEINTLPGMTPTSLLPKSAQCCGISFGDLVTRWVQFAIARRGKLG